MVDPEQQLDVPRIFSLWSQVQNKCSYLKCQTEQFVWLLTYCILLFNAFTLSAVKCILYLYQSCEVVLPFKVHFPNICCSLFCYIVTKFLVYEKSVCIKESHCEKMIKIFKLQILRILLFRTGFVDCHILYKG